VIDRLEYTVRRDGASGRSFPNIGLDLAVPALHSDEMDARFLADRRAATLSANESLRHAPDGRRRWVRQRTPNPAAVAPPGSVLSPMSNSYPSGPDDEVLLQRLYSFFDNREQAFELLASHVAANLLPETGSAGLRPAVAVIPPASGSAADRAGHATIVIVVRPAGPPGGGLGQASAKRHRGRRCPGHARVWARCAMSNPQATDVRTGDGATSTRCSM
jgi:hypothetical protein